MMLLRISKLPSGYALNTIGIYVDENGKPDGPAKYLHVGFKSGVEEIYLHSVRPAAKKSRKSPSMDILPLQRAMVACPTW